MRPEDSGVAGWPTPPTVASWLLSIPFPRTACGGSVYSPVVGAFLIFIVEHMFFLRSLFFVGTCVPDMPKMRLAMYVSINLYLPCKFLCVNLYLPYNFLCKKFTLPYKFLCFNKF